MNSSSSFRVWLGGAIAAFATGFIEGSPVGGTAGAGIAVADGQAFADLGARHVAIEAAHVLAVPVFTGLADVRSFIKDNPVPNLFAPSAPAQPAPGSAAIATEPTKP